MIGIYIYLLIGMIWSLFIGEQYKKIKDGEDEEVDDTRKFFSDGFILGAIYIMITLVWPYFVIKGLIKKIKS